MNNHLITMEPKSIKLGNSLLVPSVQELIKGSMPRVPERYIRPDQQQEPVLSDADSVDIPVINMQNLLSEGSLMKVELAKLDFACKEWGFFQLVNHGVSCTLVDEMKKGMQDFFNLPMEEKKKYWQYPGELEGFGQSFVFSEDQKLDWADRFAITTQPVYRRKPHLFPKLPSPFRETLDSYSLEMKSLAIALLKKMEKALEMETGEMDDYFANIFQLMRMNYYPPCPQPDEVIGLYPHSDSTGLTILLQANDVEGLQINKDGKWVPVKPLPNAFIVNVGDILEIISNGAYHSIKHRVTVNSKMERLSISTFNHATYDGEIGPARSLISDHKPALFMRLRTEEFFKRRFTINLNEKFLDTLRV